VKSGYLSEIFVSFQGEGAHVGRRHLFLRLAGCNLRCRYCDTPDSLERTTEFAIYRAGDRGTRRANPISADDLATVIASMLETEAPIDALAVTGGEPLAQSEFLVALLGAGRFTVPILLETNGVLPRRLREVLPKVDIVSMDIKLPSNTGEGAFWDEHAQFLDLARSKELSAKILVDQSTADEDVHRAVALLAAIRPPIPVFLQPIVDAACRPLIHTDRLTHLYRLALPYVPLLRVLPQTHKMLGIR
jgi:7-carboxy-7-deazaguanine synthase